MIRRLGGPMKKKLRNTGIDVVGAVPWGVHMGCFYDSTKDLMNILSPYISAGLENNELCICVYGCGINVNKITKMLAAAGIDIEENRTKGRLLFLPCNEWLIDGYFFDDIYISKKWNDLICHAADNGFEGIRAVVDTSWIKMCCSANFHKYERILNGIVPSRPMLKLCLYDFNKLDAFEVARIIKSHAYILTKHGKSLKLVKNIDLTAKNRHGEEEEGNLCSFITSEKVMDEFFTNLSHELRTPLNVILSAIQLMKIQKTSANAEQKSGKYLEVMEQNCYRLLKLTNNIIDMFKIDIGSYRLDLKNCDIIYLIGEIVSAVAAYAANKGITINYSSEFEKKIIACDPEQIERIILNLLSNAIKFTPGGGSIWVDVKEQGGYLRVSVRDNGIGIPQEMQKCIFDRFQKVDKSLARTNEGSGIGLFLVKALVEKHGGRITLRSKEGEGSEFIFVIPIRLLPETENQGESGKSGGIQYSFDKIDIEFSDIYS